MIQFSRAETDTGQEFLTVFVDGQLRPPVDDSHPNYQAIKAACQASLNGEAVDENALNDLFNVADTIRRRFERLSDRVTIKDSTVLVDGDPIHGTLQEQIIQFLDAGEDFAPLVEFYEKLLTNPLGDVREGLYDWINGQRANGNFTITPEGNILGYKSVKAQRPEWRKDAPSNTVYVPSRRGEGIVNGRDVSRSEFIEQVPGDTVEMPRSRVLHAPSLACADGLHIGTFKYAESFYGGDTVLLVEFSPRDIVSLPDSNATWKLRVCRYKVVGVVTEALDVPVYSPRGQDDPTIEYGCNGWEDPDLTFEDDTEDEDGLYVGDRVVDPDGDEGVIEAIDHNTAEPYMVRYDEAAYGRCEWTEDELERV